jgi:hypothetical protein
MRQWEEVQAVLHALMQHVSSTSLFNTAHCADCVKSPIIS